MTSLATEQPLGTTRERLLVYAIDGALLGLFMISACVSVVIFEHPASPVHIAIGSALARRISIGVAMGLTALALIYSAWGKRSGAFMNPAMVLCFVRLGKLSLGDAAGYIAAQLAGSALGVLLASLALPGLVSAPSVNYVVTVPAGGIMPAFFTEFGLAFLMVSVVVTLNRSPRVAPYTGACAALLVALFISLAAPISGMSINPARSFGSALWARVWSGFWIYASAPLFGMLSAVELQRLLTKRHERLCGKVNHDETSACYVRCECLKGTDS
jgi:aquaporin Z